MKNKLLVMYWIAAAVTVSVGYCFVYGAIVLTVSLAK